MTKICGRCKLEKDISEFYIRKNKNKPRSACRVCDKEYRDKNKLYFKNYRETHPSKEYQHQYHLDHLDESRQRGKEYAIINKDKIKEYNQQYYLDNIVKLKENAKQYKYNRMKIDPLFKLIVSIRSLVLIAFKRKGYRKNGRTKDIIGCSFIELKQHLEAKFTKGMNWSNRGTYGWHIDHIIPIATAKTEEDIIKLNHYSNLQPLWATSKIAENYGEVGYIGNLEKGNKII